MLKEENELIVRARGLPWSATKEDIAEFFSGVKLNFFANYFAIVNTPGKYCAIKHM